ncbi:MAG: helix-turn-helix domain-containing protein [Candidatus Bathyarchaeota archaeon]|nr:helix-turn-helix domain-containing protein [Candidatus Bathyarchaeota archaeon]
MARRRRIGARVLKAVASALRLNILRLLYERGPLSYTEIMNLLKLSPSRDAGRFAYHLKTLLGMDLIEPDATSKKYGLTDRGKTIVEFADELENSAQKKKLLVRTSRLAIENFDRNKIAESLVREAEVPIDLAQKVAREAEKRLLKLGTKYLTAPLIREFVNAILIERGLEEYRHKLTRLGFPVYDVTLLMKEMSGKSADVEKVHAAAGSRVIEEYTLLNALPRDVADAHISGALNLNNLGSWVLKASGFMHDLRFFFQHGLAFKNSLHQRVSARPPKSFKAALSMTADVLRLAAAELTCEQGVDFFNLFLAPFVKNLSKQEAKEELALFLTSVNFTVPTGVSLGLETALPSFLADSNAYGPDGEASGVYADFVDESQLVAALVLECLKERGDSKPIFNPSVVVKVRPETFKDEGAERLLYEAHRLAVDGLPYFANLVPTGQTCASYAANGLRFAPDWKKDWELDTIRSGCIDRVTLNLPRAVYDAERDRNKLFENLYDLSEKGLRALEIKYRTIWKRAQEGLLPFLIQKEEQDSYLRLENSSCLLSFVGLNETAVSMTGKAIHESEEAQNFAVEEASYLSEQVRGYAKKRKVRCALGLTPNLSAARRLAELDIEKYGLAEVHVQGGRENPYYTNMTVVPLEAELPLDDRLRIEARFHALTPGSHLVRVPLGESEEDAEHLFSTTRKIVKDHEIGLYAYDRSLTHCSNCKKTFHGEQIKCPKCGSVNAVTRFSRAPARYRAKQS